MACILIFVGATYATEFSTENTNTTYDEITNNTVFTEDILNEEINYDENDYENGFKELTNETIEQNENIALKNKQVITSTQSTNTKHIYVNPSANTNNQDGTASHPFKTIELAMSKTTNGYNNIIHLSAGNHPLPNKIQITKTITIIGNSKETTNITCNKNQGFRLSDNANLTLEKIRMQNAHYKQGGAIQTAINNKLLINNCIFNKNSAGNGAVLFTSGNTVKSNISNTLFENNTAIKFGALQISGTNTIFNINSCRFNNNVLTSTEFGGKSGGASIYTSNYAKTYVKNCIFTKNKSNWGNAILIGNHGTLYTTYSNYTNNIANVNTGSSNKTKGGAIAIGSGYLEIGNCNFNNNKADIGGAISINSGETVLIYSSVFQQNHGYTQAGAINNYGTLTVKNSKFINNNGTRRGGAILDIGNNEIFIDNCNFIDNRVLTTRKNGTTILPQGGAISIAGNCHTFNIKNSIFNHSSAYTGGAIYSEKGTKRINIEKTRFHNNTAHYGTSLVITGETILTMNNNSFTYNRGLKKGGAILINGSTQASINNTKFQNNNVSVTGDGEGGAIYVTCYATLNFNNCNFEKNFANLKGGIISSTSVVTITISRTNITNNKATTGSAIYIDNSKNYKSHTSTISIDTTVITGNQGKYALYSTKPYDQTWNNNIIATTWFGTNTPKNNNTYNFKIKNYFILTIYVNKGDVKNVSWTNENINIKLKHTELKGKTFAISINTLKEGSTYKYTDGFLPPRNFNLKEGNNTGVSRILYSKYLLNSNLNQIVIYLDNQKITINIV